MGKIYRGTSGAQYRLKNSAWLVVEREVFLEYKDNLSL